ncbi:MAG TPA: hypothetical protein VF881_06020, partial [Polyangiaceae bacterium]
MRPAVARGVESAARAVGFAAWATFCVASCGDGASQPLSGGGRTPTVDGAGGGPAVDASGTGTGGAIPPGDDASTSA